MMERLATLVLGLLVLGGASLGRAQDDMEAATRVAQTLNQISYDYENNRGPRRYTITEQDLNAYLRVILKSKAYSGVSSAAVDLRPDRVFETRVVVNMDDVELGDSISATVLRTVISGEQELVLLGRLEAEGGEARYSVLESSVNGIPIPAVVANQVIRSLGARAKPPVDPTEAIPLTDGIKRVVVSEGRADLYR